MPKLTKQQIAIADLALAKIKNHIYNQLSDEDQSKVFRQEFEDRDLIAGEKARQAWFTSFKTITIKIPPDIYQSLERRAKLASQDQTMKSIAGTVSKQASLLCEVGVQTIPEEENICSE